MMGTSRSVTAPIRLMPPMMMRPMTAMTTSPISHLGAPKVLYNASEMAFDWERFPTPKDAPTQAAEKITANVLLWMPFWM